MSQVLLNDSQSAEYEEIHVVAGSFLFGCKGKVLAVNPEQIRKKITTTFTPKNSMQLIEVTNEKLARDFIRVNVELNAGDPNYIRPLDKDINEVFDKENNKALRHGEIIRWILRDSKGKLDGTHRSICE